MEKWKSLLEEHMQTIFLLLVGLLLLLSGILVWQLFQSEPKEEAPGIDLHAELLAEATEETTVSEEEIPEEKLAVEESQEIIVDVKGAVHAPGVYTMADHHRVIDAVKKAGGFSDEAEQNAVNLAKVVEDQMVIYIPKVGEEELQSTVLNEASVSAEEPETSEALIDINHAQKEALMTLNGIGSSKADSILSYREEHGLFQTIEDIKKVSGIGDATYENLKDDITVSP